MAVVSCSSLYKSNVVHGDSYVTRLFVNEIMPRTRIVLSTNVCRFEGREGVNYGPGARGRIFVRETKAANGGSEEREWSLQRGRGKGKGGRGDTESNVLSVRIKPT